MTDLRAALAELVASTDDLGERVRPTHWPEGAAAHDRHEAAMEAARAALAQPVVPPDRYRSWDGEKWIDTVAVPTVEPSNSNANAGQVDLTERSGSVPLAPLKRYALGIFTGVMSMFEQPDGDYVKWSDVQSLLGQSRQESHPTTSQATRMGASASDATDSKSATPAGASSSTSTGATPKTGSCSDAVPRPDLDRYAHEHHWQRPDGSIYCVDSSD